jgi:hypothetical protein
MIYANQSVSTSIIFDSLLVIAVMATIQSLSSTILVSAQNMSNLTTSTTGTDNIGLVTITPEQINEIKNSINATRLAIQHGNMSEALANLSIVEEQFSVLVEGT